MKKQTARKILYSFVVLAVASLFSLNVGGAVFASAMQNQSISLSTTSPSISANYTINFSTATSATLTEVDVQFATSPSGGVTVPAGMTTTSAALSTFTLGAGWTINNTSNGFLSIINSAYNTAVAPQALTIVFGGITNPQLAGSNCPTNSSSATCYARITTVGVGSAAAIDTGASSFTVVQPVTATATVDPSLTFTVAGVSSATQTATSSVPANDISTSQSSTYSALPFGHFSANTTQDVAQSLTVATNAKGGYNVNMAMTTPMTGTYGAGYTISPFTANAATWIAPQVWVAPTTASPSSYLGAYTSDPNITAFGNPTPATIKFAPVNATYNAVMSSAVPDSGRTVYVTYQLQTDVYQQADTYTGTLQYNAIATY